MTEEVTYLVRRMVAVGQGTLLGLDSVPGVVLSRITDASTPGATVRPGEVLVEVWGGRPPDIFAAVARYEPPRTRLVVVVRRATFLHRARAKLRVWLWRLQAPEQRDVRRIALGKV